MIEMPSGYLSRNIVEAIKISDDYYFYRAK
jgi:hypothetical protein